MLCAVCCVLCVFWTLTFSLAARHHKWHLAARPDTHTHAHTSFHHIMGYIYCALPGCPLGFLCITPGRRYRCSGFGGCKSHTLVAVEGAVDVEGGV